MGDTYIVAEIGTGHAGDLGRAEELVGAAKESGADCAKFQYVIAEEIVHPKMGAIPLPGGDIPLYERFLELQLDIEFYEELVSLCQTHSIDFLCTPFGLQSARGLREIGVDRIKIASPEINHDQLLHEVAAYDLPLIVSTGVTRLSDIEHALDIVGTDQTTLLHCVTAYPAPEQEFNLRLIANLAALFGVSVGISDHSQDPVLVPALSVALGATIVEKHFTLSRAGSGLDDAIAMDPSMFATMCAAVQRVDTVLTLDPKRGPAKVLSEFRSQYGASRIDEILGDGVKRLAPCERESYATTRRSIHAVDNLAVGQVILDSDVAVLRSEKNLTPGLDPVFLSLVVGSELTQPVSAGEGVCWSHLTGRPTR